MEEPNVQPSLFVTSSTWFRASDYELVRLHGQLYVVPVQGSTIETYRPFDRFPETLQAYMETARKLKEINDRYNERSMEEMSDEDHRRLMNDRDADMGKAIIRCAKRFGLLGLLFHFIYNIEEWTSRDPERMDKPITTYVVKGRLAHRSLGTRFPFPASSYANWYDLTYEVYAAGFFPRLTSDYPLPRQGDAFRREYGEPVLSIFSHLNELLWDLTAWNEWLIAKREGASLEDPKFEDNPGVRWVDYLNRRIQARDINYAMEYNADGEGTWQESFMFYDLLSALQLMLIRDSIRKVHQVRMCDECGRVYVQASTRDSRYCSTACASKHRVAKFRKRKKAKE